MKYLKSLADFLKRNKILVLLFILSTFFFIFQHYLAVGWDFKVYTLNAKHFLGISEFFELERPPIVSLLISLFSILSFGSFLIAEYIYIIFASALFLFACVKFADKFKLNKILFYILFLTPFLLLMGLSEGTELLSLAFLILFMSFFDEWKAPVFLALAVLTRYPNMIFGIFLLFNKDIRKIIRNLVIFGLCLSPWLLFNYALTGNFLTSYMNSYALNVKFREYVIQPFNFVHIFQVCSYLLLPAVFGIYFSIKESFGKRKIEILSAFMICFAVLTLASYASTPIKLSRYAFNLILPAVYFSCLALMKVKEKKIIYSAGILLVVLVFGFSFWYALNMHSSSGFSYDKIILENQNVTGSCTIMSNAYVPLNYKEIKSEPSPDFRLVGRRIEQGYRIILFKDIAEPEYAFDNSFIKSFPILSQGDNYVVLGDSSKCTEEIKLDKTYIQSIDDLYKEAYNDSFDISAYELFFTDKIA